MTRENTSSNEMAGNGTAGLTGLGRLLLGSACFLAYAGWVGADGAAHAAAPAAPAGAEVGSLEEIVVTSRRRAERLIDVPDSITAITAETLETTRVASVADLTNLTSNVSIVQTQQPGVDLFVIRGIGQARNQEPPVAFVIDGVQQTSSYQLTQELFDVEQIEVLKGPQGALYGRNAIGGAIVVTTKQPTNDFSGKIIGGYGNGDYWEAKGVLSGPIVKDKLFFRVAGTYENFDGLIDNVTLNRKVDFYEKYSLRAQLLANLSDNLTVDLRASGQWLDSGAAYFRPVTGANDFVTPVIADHLGTASRDLQEYSAKINYDFGAASLTSVTAYSKTKSSLDEDVDYFPVPILLAQQRLNFKSWSEELRLTSRSDQRFRWMIGGYYLDISRDLATDVQADFGNFLGFLGNLGGGVTPPWSGLDANAVPGPLSSALALDDDKSYAGFGQINYDITDALELTLALRYDRNNKHQTDGVSLAENKKVFDLWQPKLSLAYKINSDATIYATVGRGFRSGGFNATDTFGRVYASEKTTNYELGFKTAWADNRLAVNGAVFYTDYRDHQEFILIVSEGAQALVNVPKARALGAELEVAARPAEGLDLTATVGLMDTSIKKFDATAYGFAPGTDFTGNQLPFVYGWNVTFAAQYRVPLFSDFDLVTRVDYSAKGDMYWHLDNTDKQKPVYLMNARIMIENERYQLTFYADNLLNEDFNAEFIAPQWSGGLAPFAYPGEPRRYGVTASVKF